LRLTWHVGQGQKLMYSASRHSVLQVHNEDHLFILQSKHCLRLSSFFLITAGTIICCASKRLVIILYMIYQYKPVCITSPSGHYTYDHNFDLGASASRNSAYISEISFTKYVLACGLLTCRCVGDGSVSQSHSAFHQFVNFL